MPQIHRGNDAVRDVSPPCTNRVGEVGEDARRRPAGPSRCTERRRGDRIVHQDARAFDCDALSRRDGPQADSNVRRCDVFPKQPPQPGQFVLLRGAGDEDRIRATRLLQGALQPRKRYKEREDRTLPRPQRELAEAARWGDSPAGKPDGPGQDVAPAVERLAGDVLTVADTKQQAVSGVNAQLRGERRADDRRLVLEAKRCGQSMKPEEPLIDPVDVDVVGCAGCSFPDEGSLDRDDGTTRAYVSGRAPGSESTGEVLSEEAIGRDHVIGRAEALVQQVAQARADGLAHDERASQHGHRSGDTGHHRGVRAPVVQEIAQELPGHRVTAVAADRRSSDSGCPSGRRGRGCA